MIITTISGPSGTNGARSNVRSNARSPDLGFFFPGKSTYTEGTDFKCTATICYGLKKPDEPAVPLHGSVHAFFEQLQGEINRFAKVAGFVPVKVDGFIGAGTMKAAQAAAKYILAVDPDFPQRSAHPEVLKGLAQGSLDGPPMLKQAIAVNAVAIYGVLGGFAEGKFPAAPPAPAPEVPITVRKPSVAVTKPGGAITPGGELPPPEFAAGVQQIIGICRSNPNDPMCTQARAGCQRVRGTPQANLPTVQQLCTAIGAAKAKSTVIWWVVGGVAAASVVGIVGYAVYRGRKKRGFTTEPTRFRRRPRGEFAPSL